MMDLRPIKTEADYEEALSEAARLMEIVDLGGDDGDRLDVLAMLIERYEAEHYPIPDPDPIEFLKFRMEHEQISRTALAAALGSPVRVSEILNKRRALTVGMIHALQDKFAIPAEVMVKPYKLKLARPAKTKQRRKAPAAAAE